MKNKIIKFKVFPLRHRKEYYQVIVLPDKETMRLTARKFKVSKDEEAILHRLQAVTYSFKAQQKVKGKWVDSKCIGAILFYKDGFGPGIVSHEMAHAVNYLFLSTRVNFNLKKWDKKWATHDEAYANCLGYLVNQFWKKYSKITKTKVLHERY